MSNYAEGLNSILKAINNLVMPQLVNLKYDKTFRGKIVRVVDNGLYEVQINGSNYVLPYSGILQVNDIVKVKSPLNNFSDIYIEAIGGSTGSGVSSDYNDLSNKPILNTSYTSSLTTNSTEIIRGTIGLHKISKTGSYNDLRDLPTLNFIPYSEKGTPNGVSTLDSSGKISQGQLPDGIVIDENYVHTDNNFTNALLTKLNGVDNNAEVNKINSISKNGVMLPIENKNVNIDIPTKLSELQNDNGTVIDKNYVHTDNNFTDILLTKLNGIEAGAEVNSIEGIKVNNVLQPINNKIININVPTQTSDLINNSGFITNSVSNLTNYYLKSETYTKDEVNDLIGKIKTISIQVVSQLPTTGQDNIIYLVPKTGTQTDIYNEYIWVSGKWELIGSTQIDLSGYATESWVAVQIKDFLTEHEVVQIINNSLTNYYTKGQIDTVLSDKANKDEIPTKTSQLTNDGEDGVLPFITKVPIASKTQIGGIKVGNNLSIRTDGTLDAVGGSSETGDYNNLINKPVLNTNISTSQLVSEGETIEGEIALHKVSKTGLYSDLNNLPSLDFIPLSQKGETNGVATLDGNKKITNTQLPSGIVIDSNYVHTDNNFTSNLLTKLNGIEPNAQVNKIETVLVNNVDLPVSNKKINITVPTTTSEITNNSGFITNTVSDLINYYSKTDIYTKIEVNDLIGQIKTISIQVVSQLPQTGKDNIIYFVPKQGSGDDVYNEYIWINNKWELIGSTQVDLEGYATETWVNTKIKDFLNETQVSQLITSSIVDNVNSNLNTKSLSANQGRILNGFIKSNSDMIDALQQDVLTLENDVTSLTNNKLETSNIKAGNNITVSIQGRDVTISAISKEVQNIVTKYSLIVTNDISPGVTIILPCRYKVGRNVLDIYYNGELLLLSSDPNGSDGHYQEVGVIDSISTQIKTTTDWGISNGDYIAIIVRGEY